MSCVIRRATKEDVLKIHEMFKYYLYSRDIILDDTVELITSFSFVALVNGEIIGFSCFRPKENQIWDYTYTVVSPWFRKLKIGSLLIQFQIDNLGETREIKKVWSNLHANNKKLTFFQAMGLTEAMNVPLEWVAECDAIQI